MKKLYVSRAGDDAVLASFELMADGRVSSTYVNDDYREEFEGGLVFVMDREYTPSDGAKFMEMLPIALSATQLRVTERKP